MPATFSFSPKPGAPGYSIDLLSSDIRPFPFLPTREFWNFTLPYNPLDTPIVTQSYYSLRGYAYQGNFVISRSGSAENAGSPEWFVCWWEDVWENGTLVSEVYPLRDWALSHSYFEIDLGRDVVYARVQDLKIGQLVRAGDNIVGSSGNDTLRTTNVLETIRAGAGDDRIEGRGGNDKIFAGPGDDLIFGGGGNDRITAEGGADVIYGGTGDDRFVFTGRTNSTPAVMDTLIDFDKSGNDVIDLAGIYGPKLAFIKGAAFTKIGQVRVNDVSGPDVVIEANVIGDLGVDFAIRIKATTLAAMTPSDFIL